MVDISDVTDNEVVMEEVTASPPPPANARYDDRLADAKELEAALANVKRPGARMHLQTIITKLHKECEALQRFASSDNRASSSPFITKLHKECEALQRFASSDNRASSSPFITKLHKECEALQRFASSDNLVQAEEEIEEASIILGSESDNRQQRGQWLGSIRGSLRYLLGGTSVSHPLEEPLLAASTGENEDRELVVAVIF
jgi:Uri superfamily endonuclease